MAQALISEEQTASATAKFIRMSPTKVRQVVDLIRGRHVDDARRVLAHTERAACAPVAKVLESAVANAEHNRALPADELVVVKTWVDEGPTLRRYRPRALGRATRIRKRTCHISVVVGRLEEPELLAERPVADEDEAEATPARKRTAGKSTTKKATGKTTAKKTTAKKTTRKTTAKKTTRKTTAKKTTAKKTTAKKTTRKKTEGGR